MEKDFEKLDRRVQKWVYRQGWTELRDIQKKSIQPILAANTDLVISASTAAGKTEAAFLPACSAISEEDEGFGVLYISPLKALINDQYRRLESLCDELDMKVTPWHGDASKALKKRAKQDPDGILLITPESLESLLVRQSGWVKASFNSLRYIVIDEYHAFVGFERGCHLQSLMHRLEKLLNIGPIPRIALSATLGDMDGIVDYLRPDKSLPCELIVGHNSQTALQMQIRGYVEEDPDKYIAIDDLESYIPADHKIADDLYDALRGSSNLIFANSRQRTENFAAMLSDRCEKNVVPNEFYPHHGSLSKELRTELEARLQEEKLPTSAVCTMTLELGIDIGKVTSVAQVTAPHSVASLRQRLGRSGRRGSPAILRMYITEKELEISSGIGDKLRLELLQSIAMIRLLLTEKWYEPSDTHLYHFSTLLHQILAVSAQWGGVRPDQLWELLCKAGPFNNVSVDQFKALLMHMGELGLIFQLGSGEIVLGDQGEKIVDHYTFYAVFKTPEEFRIVANGKTLGAIPVDSLILPDQHIIFGGRRWKVTEVDSDKKTIFVVSTKKGKPPKFGGEGMLVHDRIRQEMRRIYAEGDYRIQAGNQKLDYLDKSAQALFQEGLSFYRHANLNESYFFEHGRHCYIVPWMGDRIVNTLVALLRAGGIKVDAYAGVIEAEGISKEKVIGVLREIMANPSYTNASLAELVPFKEVEKYDHSVPEELLNLSFGERAFDVENSLTWLKKEIF